MRIKRNRMEAFHDRKASNLTLPKLNENDELSKLSQSYWKLPQSEHKIKRNPTENYAHSRMNNDIMNLKSKSSRNGQNVATGIESGGKELSFNDKYLKEPKFKLTESLRKSYESRKMYVAPYKSDTVRHSHETSFLSKKNKLAQLAPKIMVGSLDLKKQSTRNIRSKEETKLPINDTLPGTYLLKHFYKYNDKYY